MKTCLVCNKQLESNSRKYCDNCRLVKMREAELENTRSRMIRNREFIKKYKQDRGCDICGYHVCSKALDFHHIAGTIKTDTVSNLCKHLKSLEKIKEEISKCRLLQLP